MNWREAWRALVGPSKDERNLDAAIDRLAVRFERMRAENERMSIIQDHIQPTKGTAMNKFTQEEAEALARSTSLLISSKDTYEIIADTLRAKGLLIENKKPITERGYYNNSLAISGVTTPSRTIPVSELGEIQRVIDRAVKLVCDGKVHDGVQLLRREGLTN